MALLRPSPWLLAALLLVSCRESGVEKPSPGPSQAPSAAAQAPSAQPPASSTQANASAPVQAPKPEACPQKTLPVPGGRFFMGSSSPSAAPEDRPRFETEISDLCVDETEVTVDAYLACEKRGACTAASRERRFCNARFDDRGNHPINCVDWYQAQAFCKDRGARLPSEAEWEYFARGGTQDLRYSWGNEPPDGRTCWKNIGGSCPVKSFAAGAFGLHDVIGNVWEWVDDGFGPLPWPDAHSASRGYRGGSWSRRFEKWMSPKLRNRYRPKESGTHLGFRCVLTPKHAKCAFGRSADGSRCEFGVHDAECPRPTTWNGVRCARPGQPECPKGHTKQAGHGCVAEERASGPLAAGQPETPITRVRTPNFDADCQRFKPGQPTAYRYSGGTHDGRNRQSRSAGCSNRDVGVGWNSTCCP